MEFLPSIPWVLLTIYIYFALIKLTILKHIEASNIMHVIADTKAQISDFKLVKQLFLFIS